MATIRDLIPPLSDLAKQCIDRQFFGYAESFCNLLAALHSGRWDQVDHTEQTYWLSRLDGLLRLKGGLGEYWDFSEPSLLEAKELVDGLLQARQRT